MKPTISFEIARVTHSAEASDFIEAEFIPKTNLTRRKPASGKISMPLDNWLSVDRKLHELYNLCEIAIMQRDAARDLSQSEMGKSDAILKNLEEWKSYSEKLEKKLLGTHCEIFQQSHEISQLKTLAKASLNLPLFGSKKRRKDLKEEIQAL